MHSYLNLIISAIIRCLTNPTPEKRYLASQLLNDPRLIEKQTQSVEDIRELRETLKASCQTFGSPQHEAVVQELFTISADESAINDFCSGLFEDDSHHSVQRVATALSTIFVSRKTIDKLRFCDFFVKVR